jgi:replicative DNA helicase
MKKNEIASRESEMMVLGCMLTNQENLKKGADVLDKEDFYYDEHKIIFQVLQEADNNGTRSDVHLICEALKRTEKLDVVGGVVYITTLAQFCGTSAYIEEYAAIIKQKRNITSIM